MSSPSTPVTLADILRGRRGRFLAALMLAEFAAAMQGIAYSTVLPVIARDLDGFALFGATLAAGQVAAVLMLSFAAPILQRVRPLRILLVATALYVAGAALAVLAPAMSWVLAGAAVRGIAAGLFGGFGMGAIGTLFDERERPRVFGLFALIWLLPSVIGPPLNAVITDWVDWRWALGWPAVLVVLARLLMGATIAAVPWEPDASRTPVSAGVGVAVAAGLVLGAIGSAQPQGWGVLALVLGVIATAVAIAVFLVRGLPGRARGLVSFGLLCAAFFGVYELLSLALIEGLGSTVLVASAALTGGLVSWSLVGLRPRPDARPDRAAVGTALVVVAFAGLIGGLWLGGGTGVVLVIAGAVLAGLGMGAAYPLLSSEPFDTGAPAGTVGTLIAFAETAATAWVALLAGGAYSALHGLGWAPALALQAVFGLLAVIAVAAFVSTAGRRRRAD
ncbi:MAG: hypothetical protein QM582_10310 [Micropruina sp.]|uniref:MFS transporter n=1 Tax=Micropruina sp. TaxID=2737536 RepID=UPI0039E44F83